MKEKFIYWAKSNGFLVVTKEGKAKGDSYEANIDIVMAMDAIEMALDVQPNIVVLVTGDSDFAYLAEKLRRRGIRVEVASVEQSLGNDLFGLLIYVAAPLDCAFFPIWEFFLEFLSA